MCGTIAGVGSESTYQVSRGTCREGIGPPGPYVPKSNRATGSAYRLVKGIDRYTSLVVVSRGPSAGRIGVSLSGFSGPSVRSTAKGVWRGIPEPPENVTPRSNLATDPQLGQAFRV